MSDVQRTTVVIYHVDDEETPYKAKLKVSDDDVTLADFKSVLNLPRNYKFFFKSEDADFGVVKEEIGDEGCKLPVLNGRVEAWLVSADGSAHSDGKSPPSTNVDVNRCGSKSDNRIQNYHPRRFDQSACTSETESTVSGLPAFPRRDGKLDRRTYCDQYYDKARLPAKNRNTPLNGDSSVVTSDLETTSFLDSEDDRGTGISTCTDITSVSRQHLKKRKKKNRVVARPAASKVSAVSSVTESTLSLNIVTVVLNVETGGFLGITLVGQSNRRNGDGGICVGSIMSGGAVGLDGRIERGDMILQVNDAPFDGLSNDDAVRILRDAVKKPGPVKLVVAKRWAEADGNAFALGRTEPVRPIDPGAWVAHTTNALMSGGSVDLRGTASPNGARSENSGSFASPAPPEDSDPSEVKLDLRLHDASTIARVAARPDSGLEVKNRKWLKINIPDAFLGSDLVDWLHTRVQGFADKKDARKFAGRLLKDNYIRHTVNKITFSEQCYYVFGDLCGAFSSATLDAPREESDRDTVAPLPPPPSVGAQSPPWLPAASPPTYQEHIYAPAPTASVVSGYAPAPYGTADSAAAAGDGIYAAAPSAAGSSTSGTSADSAASNRSKNGPPSPAV